MFAHEARRTTGGRLKWSRRDAFPEPKEKRRRTGGFLTLAAPDGASAATCGVYHTDASGFTTSRQLPAGLFPKHLLASL